MTSQPLPTTTNWRSQLSSMQQARLDHLETRRDELLRQIALERDDTPPEPELTPEQRTRKREVMMSRVDLRTWVKAIIVIGKTNPDVILWDPADPMSGTGIMLCCDGLMAKKLADPNHRAARKVYTGEQLTHWGQEMADILMTLEPASEEQWNNMAQHLTGEIARKDKAPSAKKSSAKKKS